MSEYYSADWIFPADRAPLRNGYVRMAMDGRVIEVGERVPVGVEVKHFAGALVPGLINTHCHLELSHLKGRVDTGTGLLPFLRSVVTLRGVEPAEIEAAIHQADADMWAAGIQAVGDISNTADTAAVKATSPIQYMSFVEAFDFLQGGEMAEQVLAKALAAYEALPEPKRLVPHAPYTVSPALFAALQQHNPPGGTISIHNQETSAEDDLFLRKEGGFIDFYRDFGFSLAHFSASAKTSLATVLPYMDAERRTLLVHNTRTTPSDIELAQSWGERVYWATCPNANLYIENSLPHYTNFTDAKAKMTIGTDSLSSNWQLDLVEEMKTIQRYQSSVDTLTLIEWASLNGAQALGLAENLGSLTPGKAPGLVLIEGVDGEGRLGEESFGKRVF